MKKNRILDQASENQNDLAKMLVSNSNVRNYQEIYNQLYSKRIERNGHAYGSRSFRQIMNKLPLMPDYDRLRFYYYLVNTKIWGWRNKKILDVGCGDGLLSIALAKHRNYVIGIDVSDIALKLSNENKKIFCTKNPKFRTKIFKILCKNVKFEQMDCRKLDFPDNHFDIVIGIDLIEHLHPKDLLVHMGEVQRCLKKGGYYLIATPNGVFHKAGGLHLRTYTYNDLKEILCEYGFFTSLPNFKVRLGISPLQKKNVVIMAYKR